MKRAEVSHQQVDAREANFGDLSRTYRFPGYATLDQMTVNLPKTLSHRSPYVARVLVDGSYLRAALGPLAMVSPLVAITLAAIATTNLADEPLPRNAALFGAVAVIGILDALAGLVATVVFLLASALSGRLDSLHGIAIAIVVATTWADVPIMVGQLRSFTRTHPVDPADWWTRSGDIVLGSFFAGFITASLLSIVSAASSLDLPVIDALRKSAPLSGWLRCFATCSLLSSRSRIRPGSPRSMSPTYRRAAPHSRLPRSRCAPV
jgi:hypothetical protein